MTMWDEGRCLGDDVALGPLPRPLRVHLAWEAKKRYVFTREVTYPILDNVFFSMVIFLLKMRFINSLFFSGTYVSPRSSPHNRPTS